MNQTVLLVDDETSLVNGLRRALRSESYTIRTASSPKEALEILRTESIDVVVSDERMPGMSGTDFLIAVRQSWPETVRMMLTGLGNLDMAVRAINSGEIYRFFTKPCSADELRVAIKSALEHRQLLIQGRRLLATVRRQTGILAQLEASHPGISRLEEDDRDGAIWIDVDDGDSIGSFLQAAENELAKVGA